MYSITNKLHLDKSRLLALARLALALPVAIGFLIAPPIQAQSPAARLEFEVATIKLNTSGVGQGGMRATRGRLRVENTSLRTLIRDTYKVPEFTISGGPDWITSDRYDIEVTFGGDLKGDSVLLLLQRLVQERFQLKVHRETKEGPVYVLTLAKGGPKLQPSNCLVIDPVGTPPPPAPGEPTEICGSNRSGVNGLTRIMNVVGLKIDETDMATALFPGLTFYLSSMLERTVIDRTGLTGRFNIRLEYTPESPSALLGVLNDANTPAPVADTTHQSISTAVQEQLGLKLESGEGPVAVLVIDHVERPSEN
jgi:uncharacterized protein (TIGR03435 family)